MLGMLLGRKLPALNAKAYGNFLESADRIGKD